MSQAVDASRIPELKTVVSTALAVAARAGATQAEVDASLSQGLSVTVRLGEVETVEYQRDRALGITVYFGTRKGSASTADLSTTSINDMVTKACAIARHTAADECAGLADPALLATEFPDLGLDFPWALNPEEAVELARLRGWQSIRVSATRKARVLARSAAYASTATRTGSSRATLLRVTR